GAAAAAASESRRRPKRVRPHAHQLADGLHECRLATLRRRAGCARHTAADPRHALVIVAQLASAAAAAGRVETQGMGEKECVLRCCCCWWWWWLVVAPFFLVLLLLIVFVLLSVSLGLCFVQR
ncbi:hypothetical protein DQ04_26671000, partial [Trypanosoma grayi]|uniref:hypothetical protein n=1 Tax=Trypanosoma grayi TaxID=71804 RepID=UPI0004F4A4CD